MYSGKTRDEFFDRLVYAVLLVTLVCLALQIRFIVSLSLPALALLILLPPGRGERMRRAFSDPVFLLLLALYLLQATGWWYTHNQKTEAKELGIKGGLVAIPFFFCALRRIPGHYMRRLM